MTRLELSVADLCLRIVHPEDVAVTDRFAPFVCRGRQPDYTAEFIQVDRLPAVPPAVYEDVCWRLHPDGDGHFLRTFFDAPRDLTAYALGTYRWEERRIRIEYLPKGLSNVRPLENCFFNLAWEELMLRQRRPVLHASCLRTHLGGLLFSGPSGIGKSTQSKLWLSRFGGQLLNEDRPILQLTGPQVLAWGAPYAGSSRCYINESCPVKLAVLLRQGRTCSVRELHGREAFTAIYRNLTLNTFDPHSVETACDLTGELLSRIPVLEFTCTPTPEAAVFLEKEVARL